MSVTHHLSAASLNTLVDYVRWSATALAQAGVHFGHGTDNAWDEARMLVFGALCLPFDLPEVAWHSKLTPSEQNHIESLLTDRIESRRPTAYLLGKSWFAGYEFYVNEHVLVPRSPFAELIHKQLLPWSEGLSVHRLLDMCTGSGCIGIAAALEMPWLEVDLVDVSPQALEVARRNVLKFGLEDRVRVIESDLFAALQGEQYDVILSNPPYVSQQEMLLLPSEYNREPRLGLVSGEDGLDITRQLLAKGAEHLTQDGLMMVEVGNSWVFLEEAYPQIPFNWVELESGGHGIFAIYQDELLALAEAWEQ